MNASRKPSLCIVSHFAYGAMTGGRSGHIGGVEWQTTLTAKWFARQGYRVTMITWNEGGPDEEWIDGVRVLKLCSRDDGLPVLRFVYPRWSSLVKALRKADADVYYHNCGEAITGQIALWCRRNNRRFVFSSANDTDCDPKLPELRGAIERRLFRYALHSADRLVVQTEKQRQLLQDGFGLRADVIPMPCPGPETVTPRNECFTSRILWIARVWIQKRPDRLLDVADACPDLLFDFVGPAFNEKYSQAALQRAKCTPNVTVHGAVPRSEIQKFYQNAACLCCTSDYEGFPNTFLEAWSYGLPIVSTFDPDSVIQTKRLGIVARDTGEIIAGVRKLLNCPAFYRECSQNARNYYVNNHTVEAVLPKFEQIFRVAAEMRPSAHRLNEAVTRRGPVGRLL